MEGLEGIINSTWHHRTCNREYLRMLPWWDSESTVEDSKVLPYLSGDNTFVKI